MLHGKVEHDEDKDAGIFVQHTSDYHCKDTARVRKGLSRATSRSCRRILLGRLSVYCLVVIFDSDAVLSG